MHFPSLVSPPKNPIATGPGTIGDGAGPLGGGLLLDGTRTVVQGDGPVVGGANVCPIGPEVVSAAEAVRAEARRRYEGIPGDIMAKLAPFEAVRANPTSPQSTCVTSCLTSHLLFTHMAARA